MTAGRRRGGGRFFAVPKRFSLVRSSLVDDVATVDMTVAVSDCVISSCSKRLIHVLKLLFAEIFALAFCNGICVSDDEIERKWAVW